MTDEEFKKHMKRMDRIELVVEITVWLFAAGGIGLTLWYIGW